MSKLVSFHRRDEDPRYWVWKTEEDNGRIDTYTCNFDRRDDDPHFWVWEIEEDNGRIDTYASNRVGQGLYRLCADGTWERVRDTQSAMLKRSAAIECLGEHWARVAAAKPASRT